MPPLIKWVNNSIWLRELLGGLCTLKNIKHLEEFLAHSDDGSLGPLNLFGGMHLRLNNRLHFHPLLLKVRLKAKLIATVRSLCKMSQEGEYDHNCNINQLTLTAFQAGLSVKPFFLMCGIVFFLATGQVLWDFSSLTNDGSWAFDSDHAKS